MRSGHSDILTEIQLLQFALIPMKRPTAKFTLFNDIGALVRAPSGHSSLGPIGQRPTLRGQLLRNHFGLCEEQKVVAAAGFRVCA
jgi:hypothetical protein